MSRVQTRERSLAARIASQPPGRLSGKVNSEQLRRDVEEFAQLGKTIQAEIAEAQKGTLPKDLSEHLKKIQKLSKRLRAELSL